MNTDLLAQQFAEQDAIEWVGLITGVFYVILAVYQRPVCWVFGILSSAALAWKSFTDYKLMADGFLQLFYIAIGILGLWAWWRGQKDDQPKPIIRIPLSHHVMAIGSMLLISIPVSWLLITYAEARYGYVDTVLTLGSVWATWLLVRKELFHWWYWIVVDIVYVWLYWKSEGYLFAILFFIYTVIAILGWIKWKNAMSRTPSMT